MSRALQALLEKVPADKRAALEAELKGIDGFITELDAGFLRQDDYSRKLDEAKTAREAWETEKKLIEENWTKAKDAYDELVADYNTTADERKAARERLAQVEKELSEHKAKTPAIDPAKVLTPEQYKEEQAKFAAGQAGFFRDVMATAYEIEQLTKTRVNPADLMDGAFQSKKSAREYAEEKYKLTELRKKAEEEAQKAHDDKIRQEEREKVIAQYANPHTRPLESSRDPFITKVDDQPKQPWEITDTPADERKMLDELSKARIQ